MLYYTIIIFIAMSWGASFLLMALSVPEFGAINVAIMRIMLGGLVLFPFIFNLSKLKSLWQYKTKLFFIGLSSTIAPFILWAFAMHTLEVGYSSTINALTPINIALLAILLFNTKITARKLAGVIIGFLGAINLVYFQEFSTHGFGSISKIDITGVLLGVVATILYGLGANLIKNMDISHSGFEIAATIQFFGGLLLLPIFIINFPVTMPSTTAWVSVILLGTISTGMSLALFFFLLSRFEIMRVAITIYLVPVFGVMWGVLFLDEKVSFAQTICGAIIVFASYIINSDKVDKKLK